MTTAPGYDVSEYAQCVPEILKFLDSSPSPFHTVRSSRQMLESAGFVQIHERDDWNGVIGLGGKYYLTRNGSSIIAFAIGSDWKPSNPISVVAAHTDSPCFHIKPHSRLSATEGYSQIGVSTYGGGLWGTWFDRDLSLAGRVIVRDESGADSIRLIHMKKPILRIPSLAIHLHRQDSLPFNKEEQLIPIAGLISNEVNKTVPVPAEGAEPKPFQALAPLSSRHHPRMLLEVAKDLGIDVESITDFELCLYDTQAATIGGMDGEFINSGRLDNLVMSYSAIRGLIQSLKSDDELVGDSTIRMALLFDNEEIGSRTSGGADSDFLPSILRRLTSHDIRGRTIDSSSTAFAQSCAQSLILSADMAHAVHPNYVSKHEVNHRPHMNNGPVIKVNANSRYATLAPGRALLAYVSEEAGVPLQQFAIRNDSPCGSTIGPFLNSLTGIQTVDIGNPQLAMHSIRETGGVQDVIHAVRLLEQYYSTFGKKQVFKRTQITDDFAQDEQL